MQSDSGGSSGGGPPAARGRRADLSGSGPGSLVSAMTFPGVPAHRRGACGPPASSIAPRTGTATSRRRCRARCSAPRQSARRWLAGSLLRARHHRTRQPCAPVAVGHPAGHGDLRRCVHQEGLRGGLRGLSGPRRAWRPPVHRRPHGRAEHDRRGARAAEHLPEVSTKWAAFGGSQGGGAAWAAAEQAGPYASDLNLVGAVALAPAADVSGLVTKAERGHDEQRPGARRRR